MTDMWLKFWLHHNTLTVIHFSALKFWHPFLKCSWTIVGMNTDASIIQTLFTPVSASLVSVLTRLFCGTCNRHLENIHISLQYVTLNNLKQLWHNFLPVLFLLGFIFTFNTLTTCTNLALYLSCWLAAVSLILIKQQVEPEIKWTYLWTDQYSAKT